MKKVVSLILAVLLIFGSSLMLRAESTANIIMISSRDDMEIQ